MVAQMAHERASNVSPASLRFMPLLQAWFGCIRLTCVRSRGPELHFQAVFACQLCMCVASCLHHPQVRDTIPCVPRSNVCRGPVTIPDLGLAWALGMAGKENTKRAPILLSDNPWAWEWVRWKGLLKTRPMTCLSLESIKVQVRGDQKNESCVPPCMDVL